MDYFDPWIAVCERALFNNDRW